MGSRFPYFILFFLFSTKLFCQDILFLKDSTQQEVKVLEINTESIKYKRFNYLDGPVYILPKTELRKIVFKNGTEEVIKPFLSTSIPLIAETHSITPIQKPHRKIGDYIKFNVQLGGAIYNKYSNVPYDMEDGSMGSDERYFGYHKNNNNISINLGINTLFGRSPYVKTVLGINYLRSKGEFDYEYSQGGYTSYKNNFHYTSKLDFINVLTGLRFTIFKQFHIEPLISFNILANSDVRFSGTATTTYISGGPNPTPYKTETEYYTNKKTDKSPTEHTISLAPRASYSFKIKDIHFETYLAYNLAASFRLPWWMIGITYYPFKKLR